MKRFNFEAERKALIANRDYLKSLPVDEYTLRKKWDELQNKIYPDRLLVHVVRDGIWVPTDIMNEKQTVSEIEAMKPKVIIANDGDYKIWWDIFRLFASTAEYNQPPTRHIRFLVLDEARSASWLRVYTPLVKGLQREPPGKVLGFGAISGDLPSIGCREKFIGWSKEQKHKMLPHHSAVGSTIVPTQPFGTNCRGGKLIAALATSALLRTQWQLQYDDILVGMTTTSLYGRPSMYDGMRKWWKPVGDAVGAMPIQPDDAIYARWRNYVKKTYPKEFREATQQEDGKRGPVTSETTRVLSLIFRVAGIPLNECLHRHKRGVYYSCFYENSKEFLRGEITENALKMKPVFQDDTKAILDWWRPMAIAEYKKLKAKGKLKPEVLFYNHGYLEDYETFKAHYLKDVGR